jgi:hypothetical protein
MVSGHYSEWRETQNIVPLEKVERPESDRPSIDNPAVDSAQIPLLDLQLTALTQPE